jgi:opacity protein-like surface antigen
MSALDRGLSALYVGTALAFAVGLGSSTAAKAQSQADFAQLLEAMKRSEARANAMETRLAALEKENRRVKQEAAEAHAESRALRQKYGTLARPTLPAALPHDTYAMATKAPPLAPAPSWGGLYWGAAFGLGLMRARDDRTTNTVSDLMEGVPVRPLMQTTITTTMSTASAPFGERTAGGIANLFLGYNFLPTPSVVLGAQVEGGVSNIRATTGPVATVSNQTIVQFNPSGAGSSTLVTTAAGDNIDTRWMVSVLGRAGVLVDPQDLLYLIGGYTYARSEAFAQGVNLTGAMIGPGLSHGALGGRSIIGANLDGATIGAGWERQVASGWSLRGEYRYTRFRSRDASQTLPTGSVLVLRDNFGVAFGGQTENDGQTQTNHVSADMHSLWLGVAHYFGH